MGFALFRQFKTQDAILILGRDFLFLDTGDIEAAGIRAISALAAQIVALLIFFLCCAVALGMNG